MLGLNQLFQEMYNEIMEQQKATNEQLRLMQGNLLHRLSETDRSDILHDTLYVVLDTETTGLKPFRGDEIISVAACRLNGSKACEAGFFQQLINPGRVIPPLVEELTGIENKMVADCEKIPVVLDKLVEYVGDSIIIGHSVSFDMLFINQALSRQNKKMLTNLCIDTVVLSYLLYPQIALPTLENMAQHLNINLNDRHTALGDVLITAEIFSRCLKKLEGMNIESLTQLHRLLKVHQSRISELSMMSCRV